VDERHNYRPAHEIAVKLGIPLIVKRMLFQELQKGGEWEARLGPELYAKLKAIQTPMDLQQQLRTSSESRSASRTRKQATGTHQAGMSASRPAGSAPMDRTAS
jgi:hypothetical protein